MFVCLGDVTTNALIFFCNWIDICFQERSSLDELESAEKVYQHRVVPHMNGFECQDCRLTCFDLMALVTSPCTRVTPTRVVPDLEKPLAPNVPVPIETAAPVKDSQLSPEQVELQKELEALEEQEALLREMEDLAQLEAELELKETESLMNSTIPAPSECSPFESFRTWLH